MVSVARAKRVRSRTTRRNLATAARALRLRAFGATLRMTTVDHRAPRYNREQAGAAYAVAVRPTHRDADDPLIVPLMTHSSRRSCKTAPVSLSADVQDKRDRGEADDERAAAERDERERHA